MKNIVLCGFMGCGKSTVGKRLAARYGMTFVDMDTYIEDAVGKSIRSLFEDEGEAAFRALERNACQTLGARDDLVIATGGGAVLSDDNVRALKQNGTIILLDVTAETVLTRLQHDTTRPLLQRDDKDTAVRTLLAERAPRYRAAAEYTVAADADADVVAAAIASLPIF